MGGGGGGAPAPTSSTVTQSNIPEYLRPQVEMVLGGATQELFNTKQTPGTYNPDTGVTSPSTYEITGTKPYQPYSTDPSAYVAPFSSMQQQAMQGTAGMQLPSQFGPASGMVSQAGMGGLDVAQQSGGYGALGAGFGAMGAGLAPSAQRTGQQAAGIGRMGLGAVGLGSDVGAFAGQLAGQQAGAGGAYAGQATSPESIQAYMSPYMQNVVQVQQQDAQRQADIAKQGLGAQFAKSGAFGGGRFGVQQGMAAADLARQKGAIQAQGSQQAFSEAQKAQQFGANLGLQGLSGAQQGLGNVLQGGQLGLSGIDRAMAGQQAQLQGLQQAGQLYGLGMQGAGVGLQGAQGAAAGYGLTGQMGSRLGELGGQQLAAQQGIFASQNQMGMQQQQQQQAMINQAIQNYAMAQQAPLERLQQYNALLRGYALPGTTSMQYQAAPPVASQLAGLGLAGAGAADVFKGRAGGTVRDNSGIDRLALRRALTGA